MSLPDEILLEALSYLSVPDLLPLRRVSKKFNTLSLDNSIWRNFCQPQWPLNSLEARDQTGKRYESDLGLSCCSQGINWYDEYRWRRGKVSCERIDAGALIYTFCASDDEIVLMLDNGSLASYTKKTGNSGDVFNDGKNRWGLNTKITNDRGTGVFRKQMRGAEQYSNVLAYNDALAFLGQDVWAGMGDTLEQRVR